MVKGTRIMVWQTLFDDGDRGNVVVVVLRTPQFAGLTRSITGDVTLRFECTPGQTYRLQYRDDLANGGWIDLSGNLVAQEITLSFNDAHPAGVQRFYRLVTGP